MKDPEPFDENDWIKNELGKGDQERFNKLFDKKYREIKKEDAIQGVKNSFEQSGLPHYRLFKAVVDGFSPDSRAEGSASGFETRVVNPLYERGQTAAEILLAKPQPGSSSVHICFVSCEIGGENSQEWRQDINQVQDVLESSDNRQHLKEQIQCDDLDIRTVQYLTVSRDRDLFDIDMDVMKAGTNPENYALWEFVEIELPETEEEKEENETIRHYDGEVAHPDLARVGEEGIDYSLVQNDDIRYSLTTHPIYPIGIICLEIYTSNQGHDDFPKQFYREEFVEEYKNKIYLGQVTEEIEHIIQGKVAELLTLAVDSNMLDDDDDDLERDYKIKWPSDDAGDVKEMVKSKYYKHNASDKRGELAFERARENFQKEEQSLDEYMSDSSE
ncbi:hypothetical protein [Haloarchaeobius sp. DT45]|uniref:hypothetical protein n=1 Tax=Haloarchaeobius sp. DT45 TaxID=3446116 RepID=UPI003F6B6C9C